MKKNIISILLLFSFCSFYAQDDNKSGFYKGDVVSSILVNFNSKKYVNDGNDYYKTSNILVMPRLGNFITNNIVIGAGIGIESNNIIEKKGNTENKVNTFLFEVFGRYYLTPTSDFSLFTEISAAYVLTDYLKSDIRVNGFNSNLGLGMNYFVSTNWSIETLVSFVNYTTQKANFTNSPKFNNVTFNTNLSHITIGVNYKF